jgi:putative transposase
MTTTRNPLPKALIDRFLADYIKPEDPIGQGGRLTQLTKALFARALQAELTEHLGHDKNALVANATGNIRIRHSKKTLKGEFGELPLEIRSRVTAPMASSPSSRAALP